MTASLPSPRLRPHELFVRVRALVVGLAFAIAVALSASPTAHAQAAFDAASPPTKGGLYRDGQTDRYLLGGAWLYRADPGGIGLAQGFWRDAAATAGWSGVRVPNAYNAGDFSTPSMTGSVGWYRRDLRLPPKAFARSVRAADRHWIIRFESINYYATIWLNGHQIGSHAGAYVPFELDLRGLRAGVNRLIVRVDNRRTPEDFPPGPSGLWWNYGGILREVYMRPVQRADLAQVQVRPLLRCPRCAATISEQALVRNVTGSPQSVRLDGAYGTAQLHFGTATIAPHATWTARAEVQIAHPRLWSPSDPALYRATLTLADARGKRLGGYLTESGVRSITVSRGGRLELNGRLLNLRGVALHEQSLQTGAALDPGQLRRLFGWIRAIGAKVIRAHYPLNPEIQELADRDGVLIWSEVPVYQVHRAHLAQPGWAARAEALVRANILANQNHPSVMLWSIGNELPTPPSSAEASYIAGAVALAHRLDPTRPVGMAITDWPGVPCQRAYAPLDVIGYNDYFGWFDAGGGTTDDRSGLGPFLDSLRACYARKALMVTEFGAEGSRSGPVEVRGTYAFQSDLVAYHLGVFASKRWLSGAIAWILQDFVAKPGWSGGDPVPHPPFVEKGAVDFFGNRKPVFGVLSSVYHATRQIAPRAGR